MKQVNLAEAKAKLSHFVDQAAKGKGVIIAKSEFRWRSSCRWMMATGSLPNSVPLRAR